MVNIISYGSLLNKESLAKTIPNRTITPVWIKGYKKIFNLKPSRLNIYKDVNINEQKVAVLNVTPDKGYCSCAYIEVDDYEFEKLKIRERSYYTKKMPIYDFKTKEKIGEGVIFIGKKIWKGEIIVSDDYLPIPVYLERCRKGAYQLSEDFGKLYDETCFIGDGRTVKEYLKE